jgi:hypothetical protein
MRLRRVARSSLKISQRRAEYIGDPKLVDQRLQAEIDAADDEEQKRN